MAEYIHHLRKVVGSEELLQLPSASVALRDEQGRVLLARHAEGDVWLLPGGGIEPGETPADAAVREMWEETGLLVRLTRLVGVFGGSEHIIRYRNGDRTSYVTATFEATPDSGRAQPDGSELLEMRFVSEPEANALRTAPWVPEILRAVFHPDAATAFRAPTWLPATRR
jgi:8-oxo-dGTP pyrophosphatase MutT (NUDIX family)